MPVSEHDRRYMAAAIRLSRSHLGLTGTNPSVATLIVKDGTIVGRGVTAVGGRPHAEAIALAEAGEAARGATAYVTLEPCAHHGKTPPCANALVNAGVTRVVAAANDPDDRVAGKGYAILRDGGLEVETGILARQAADCLAGYLTRSARKRPEVTLKLALSGDGFIGRAGAGQVAISGDISRAQVHLMRAQSDAILVGIGTALDDDPQLTCRLPGLEQRSPIRIVLDSQLRLPAHGSMVRSALTVPVWIAASADADASKRQELMAAGCRILATETDCGLTALQELLDDLAAQGIATLMVEGGATVAGSFLGEGLVDRLVLFEGPDAIGKANGVAVPALQSHIARDFDLLNEYRFGKDRCSEYIKRI
ncbi:bifunctional diaminohydroxyphosphoribosylaminopyrimidine deaminase/5-amino-6-(5-phosphoribosylamino)uracil reductase RibD [Phyllobacterium sp. 21LDTY02-6]|uniref:bifunctional diaminohydroxyphosphoribosylaminopyrimidine deaminase/5-amino-6-(5-phosphoribosylamino)uracil reductase RibD n=1 Tax=Phyllobacterium sp. 21LDTY02-6 TaxID=2944903 RepID=UPI0020209E94|nr:bifunctional diaminohydroxyphosphoribosylaminopyrimidine deaminase/5-amino-6-(5-phosphoribosylamino)uracil reductase RibD [Phyllobacterium sp. 21LDTY02-6]MCO4319674.1 bifunctional diaminohydroxyphosphoribosylaminopyrimidine deaminase/5-amino-6-(5-phosphoribosylamino)uracil reductase RibD [Phyllobacterium sp. 21LDTY02-6]